MNNPIKARTTIPHDVTLESPGTILDLFKKYVDICGNEFCGKCMPCRYGTKVWQERFQNLIDGHGTLEDIQMIQQINLTMKSASLCIRGLNSPYVIDKMLNTYQEQIEHYILKKVALEKTFISIPAELLEKD
ncbi:MAG: NADH-ubiquinone oxidoreductase-F iron-sulfur binding region domain-containing protein [Brevinema sp.]